MIAENPEDGSSKSVRFNPSAHDERAILHYWHFLRKWSWLICGVIFVSILFVFWISMHMPNIYESMAKISPLNTRGMTRAEVSAHFMALIKSQKMMDEAIKTFALKGHYDTNTMESTREKLGGNTIVKAATSSTDPFLGRLTIRVLDTDPQMAANIANFYVESLGSLNLESGVSQNRKKSFYFKQRLAKVGEKLAETEDAIKTFFSANDRAKEIQKSQGIFLNVDSSLYNILSTLGDPAEALRYKRLARELNNLETLYSSIQVHLELSKADELTYEPSFQVLDKAVPSKGKIRPKIGVNLIVAGVVGFIFANFLIFFLEYFRCSTS